MIWAARQEMARTVEDVLARRSRSLILDAQAAAAPQVAEFMADELGRDGGWGSAQAEAFGELAEGYVLG